MNQRGKIKGNFLAGLITLSFFLIVLTLVWGMGRHYWSANRHYEPVSHVINSDTVPSSALRPLSDSSMKLSDSISRLPDSLRLKDSASRKLADSLAKRGDTTLSRDSIDAPVHYTARDSGVMLMNDRQFMLYGKSNVKYRDVSLTAATIQYLQKIDRVRAFGIPDSTDTTNPMNKPNLTQGDQKSTSDSILFNMKSMKGLSHNTYYNEGELFVNAKLFKKATPEIYYGEDATLTTCNLDTPHFAFRTRKLKMINNKYAVSGPAFPEVEGIPIPVGIPFGFYPLQKGRHSGLLTPTFIESDTYGFGLEGLGYYKVINDNLDVTLKSNLYSYGGWMININPKYIKRYRYSGSFSLTLENSRALTTSTATSGEFSSTKTFNISWTHTRDNRAHPGTTFSASVNFGSTRYNTTAVTNTTQYYTNQTSSSIAYTKSFGDKANLSLNMTHNQNSVTHLVNFNLPTATFSVVTQYPFQKKERVGAAKWYENIGISYSGTFENQFSYYDTAFNFHRLLDTLQYGVAHSIPITLTLPAMGPVTLTPSMSYSEDWMTQEVIRSWNDSLKLVQKRTEKGFFSDRQITFGVSASTRLFGNLNVGKLKFHHEILPTISLSYHPDLSSKYYYDVQVDTLGNTERFSKFDGSYPSGFAEGLSGAVGFGVDNILQMKVPSKTDTSNGGLKKVTLLDRFGFSSSYNLLATSFPLSTFSLYASSNLFNKINLTFNAVLDPYQINQYGYRVNKLAWAKGSLGRITSGSIAATTSLQSKTTNDGKSTGNNTSSASSSTDPFMTPEEQQRQSDYMRSNPSEYTNFNIPWTLSLSYSLSFSKSIVQDSSGSYSYVKSLSSNLSFSGDFSLTPNWKMGGSGYLDVSSVNFKMQSFNIYVTRDLHCWQLSINVTPVGSYRYFGITLSPKASLLKDLRVNRTRYFYNE